MKTSNKAKTPRSVFFSMSRESRSPSLKHKLCMFDSYFLESTYLFIGCVLIAVWNFSLVVMHGLLVAVASLVTEHRF